MQLFPLSMSVLVHWIFVLLVAGQVANSADTSPRSNNGLTTAVEWDDYSFFILGNRTFMWVVYF